MSRTELIGWLSLTVAVVAVLVAVTTPEIRRWASLDLPPALAEPTQREEAVKGASTQESGASARPASRTGSIDANSDPAIDVIQDSVIDKAREALTHLNETRYTGVDADYWEPNGNYGIKTVYFHLATFVSYRTLASLSPVPVFKSGPHSRTTLDLSSRFSFGHYNPDFLRWAHNHLAVILEDSTLVAATTPLVRTFLWKTSSNYLHAFEVVQRYPREVARLVEDYQASLQTRSDPIAIWGSPDMAVLRKDLDLPAYSDYVWPQAVMFWLRRDMDGTSDKVYSMLKLFSDAYGSH